jgi:hypothetical protein
MIKWGGVAYLISYKWKKFKHALYCFQYRARDLLVFYIPSDKIRELPKSQALPLGIASVILLLVTSSYLFAFAFARLYYSNFLALDEDSSSVCETVMKDISGDYYCKLPSTCDAMRAVISFPVPSPLMLALYFS